LRFQKGDKLIAPDIEKEVSKVTAFFDLNRVRDDRFEAQNTLVKLRVLSRSSGSLPSLSALKHLTTVNALQGSSGPSSDRHHLFSDEAPASGWGLPSIRPVE
jgi:hypothetical protein